MIVLTLNIIEKKNYECFISSFDEILNRKLLILKCCFLSKKILVNLLSEIIEIQKVKDSLKTQFFKR